MFSTILGYYLTCVKLCPFLSSNTLRLSNYWFVDPEIRRFIGEFEKAAQALKDYGVRFHKVLIYQCFLLTFYML